MARDYHAEWLARNARAKALGFSSDAERTAARKEYRESHDTEDVSSAALDQLAFISVTYTPGDYGEHGDGFNYLKNVWIEAYGYDQDWEPDDDFYAWLDELSGEPA